ncbi:MAG: carbon monoxide dehydrogenase [Pseudonocardiaceae bacterium]|nr:carbon monoxide dehydrogenase [Pseudonocardiaceae bacterium]
MKMEHNFTVPAPVDTVWEALLDLERVVPCMPGATLSSHDGDEFAGTVKVKVGPISLQYKGSGRFTERDEAARHAVIEASGRDARGNGTAAATVTARLAENGSGTAVTVVTDLSITGRPAQFGRGLISDVGGKIIGQFADCLAVKLGTEQPAPATPTPVRPAPAPMADEINLLDSAGVPVLKRLVPVVAGLTVLFVILRRLKHRRS